MYIDVVMKVSSINKHTYLIWFNIWANKKEKKTKNVAKL